MDVVVSAACELLAKGRAFVLATIIDQQGSAPRTAGTRMLITAACETVGTIGGGLLEAETMKAAAQMNEEAPARFLTFDLTHQDAANLEMICGGRVRVLLDYIQPDDDNRVLFTDWRDSLAKGRKAMLISIICGDQTHIERIDHALLMSDQSVQARATLSAAFVEKLSAGITIADHVQVLSLDERLVVVDPGRIAQPLYIFGAGHVSRPTAHLAALVGFGVVVLDDRADFADPARFPDAVAVQTLSSFDGAFENLAVTADAYIVIVTRGHLHDRTVLAQALKTPAAYIGMIGSRRKRDTIYEQLLKDGFTAADIARVHSPIGLTIGADTPEEIAVSIVAELIAVRAGVKNPQGDKAQVPFEPMGSVGRKKNGMTMGAIVSAIRQ
ncbi:MAG: XdhC family protein [Desulfobacterales bacterium]|jgi:xanthine dehydrogenase accessory factor|nr:XdhC family protein [Desulfobacterales bacterium]